MPTAASWVENDLELEFREEERFLRRMLCDCRTTGETGETAELTTCEFAGDVKTMGDEAEFMRLWRHSCNVAVKSEEVSTGCEDELKREYDDLLSQFRLLDDIRKILKTVSASGVLALCVGKS